MKVRVPSTRELLEGAWRVFAVFLLVLLVANLMFPDNLYAKGSSGFRGGGGGSTHSFHFSDPAPPTTPYRYHFRGGSMTRTRVYDSTGRDYPAQPFVFADPVAGQRPVSSLLALSPELRLLEFGMLSYAVAIPGYQFLLHPDRLQVMDPVGRDLLSLHPGSALQGQAAQLLAAQGPLLEKALAEHRRWLEWTRWAARFGPGQEASAEQEHLERIRTTLHSAQAAWRGATAPLTLHADREADMIFPGVSLDRIKRELVLVGADGTERPRSLDPPSVLTDEDRFLFWVLYHRTTTGRDLRFRDIVERWRQAHGPRLGAGG